MSIPLLALDGVIGRLSSKNIANLAPPPPVIAVGASGQTGSRRSTARSIAAMPTGLLFRLKQKTRCVETRGCCEPAIIRCLAVVNRMNTAQLFTPVRVASLELANRIVIAPM